MRVGIAHHFGWAVAVTAGTDHRVVDRRRLELVEPGVTAAPIHHRGGHGLDDEAMAALVATVRASAVRATSAALDGLVGALPEPVVSLSLLGERAAAVLEGPRAALGPPWNRDHRIALAATVVAAQPPSR